MIGKLLAIITYIALAHARAIVTNNCPHNIYVSSVPILGLSHTDNVSIKPGGQYQEPWRQGSPETPGIAIKVSSQADGVIKFADEIDFAYAIDYQDKSKVWVDLSPVRGDALHHGLSFHSCVSSFNTADVQTHQCHATDEVELVLCGANRSSTTTVTMPLEQVQACYDPDSSDSDDEAECHQAQQGAQAGANTDNTKKSNCPVCDRLPTINQCQAKVVYPARRAGRMPTPRIPPVPAITQHESRSTLCDIVRKYHPDVKDCEEERLQGYARTVYPRICESEYEPFLLGFPCEEVAKEVKSAYPGVTNTTTTFDGQYEDDCMCADNSEECPCTGAMRTRQDLQATSNSTADTRAGPDDRVCLYDLCEPTIPGIDCTDVADIFTSIAKVYGQRYEDVVNEIPGDCSPSPAIAIDGFPVVCINKLCALQPGADCEDLQTLLQSAVKAKFDRDIEFTIDGTICGN
ncbi:hypothetical protein DDE82_003856 [Stemphylium lycopersici]|nr:bys1 domain-containing protein [Stemphylium lycopersici]RAR05667.1 hypothetical protein DDE82_003856 [Stemphylium lycopersici]